MQEHDFPTSTFTHGVGLAPTGSAPVDNRWHQEDGISVRVFCGPRTGTARLEPGDTDAYARDIVRRYRTMGSAFVSGLPGSFALALADPASDTLVLAVDRIGVATLCFAHDGDHLHFGVRANDVAALLRPAVGATVNGRLNLQSIFDYLYFHCIPGPNTVFRDVQRLPPGHALVFGSGRVAVEPFWTPTYEEHDRTALSVLEREFLGTVEGSVRQSIVGASQPGCFLSGGTDSSTIAGMLGHVTGAPARTYSIGFDAEGFDEMAYARIASRHFKTDQHEYYITPSDLVASIPLVAASFDQPFGNSSVLPTYYCARMAEADGVDLLLGGDGGDELFGGNTRYAKQKVFDLFDRAPTPVRALLNGTLSPPLWSAIPLMGKARSYVRQARVPMPDRMQTYNLVTRIGVETIFEPSFLAAVDSNAPAVAMRTWYARAATDNLVNRMLAFDLKYTLADNDLPKVVGACRAGGVDVAFPFLDDSVVAFANRLRPGLKLNGLRLRWFFKRALRDFLPQEILTKSKHGFGLPFGIWMRRDKALSALAFESLDALKDRGIVRPGFIDLLRADLLSDHATYYGELIWALMMLEQWLQAHTPSARR